MKILVVGGGGREHALVWKLNQSQYNAHLFCAPGNAGIAKFAEIVPISPTDINGLLNFALTQKIDLTIVGPEQPLIDGIVDIFESQNLKIVGPSKLAAKIEGEKVFAKHFMKRHNIPTAEFRTFDQLQMLDAERYISEIPLPVVIKANGLAGGKGVSICESKENAISTLVALMKQKIFGEAGLKVVIEQYLTGEEISVLVLTDGKEFLTLLPAQDYKRIVDNDKGKNTGGMGAYAPVPFVSEDLMRRIEQQIIKPTLDGLSAEGYPFRGCLYAGIILTETGPKVLEFNCRFGDPETQVILPLLQTDLVDLMIELSFGKLNTKKLQWFKNNAVCVVIASGGYPDKYETGKKIFGLENAAFDENVIIFHSGTKKEKENIVTTSGRVLSITAVGPIDDLEGTIRKVYCSVKKITFDGAYYRSDIGKKGLNQQIQNN